MYVSICLNLNRTKITIYIYGSSYTYIVLYIFKKITYLHIRLQTRVLLKCE
jgi:hypothetical protein